MNDYKSLSEEEQIRLLSEDGFLIKGIKKPSEVLQLAAVENSPWSIEWIKNPTDKAQIKALENKWTKRFYDLCIRELPNKSEWFYRELNRLKLFKGPLV